MDVHCHRCGSPLGSEDTYCSVCAAPQLRVELADADQASASGAERATAPLSHERRGTDWHKALRVAVMIALPVGVLTALPGVSLGFLFWVVGGAAMAVVLYSRHKPGAPLDRRSGFRLGALTGLFAAYISTALVGALQILERYSLHLGPIIDREYTERMEQSTAMVQTTADTEAQVRAYLHFLLTPDGRAAMSLAGAALTAVMTVLLAGLGGVLGVRYFARRRAA
jgi:hypothetical protein